MTAAASLPSKSPDAVFLPPASCVHDLDQVSGIEFWYHFLVRTIWLICHGPYSMTKGSTLQNAVQRQYDSL